jgi:hypothetical protein
MPFRPTLYRRLTRAFPIRHDENDARCLATYSLFLKFFKERIAVENLRESDAKIGVVLVFSWMQSTPLKPECWKYFPQAKRILQQDKVARLKAAEIDVLKVFVGGSLMATSKFLHFFNPRRYAMWDTNVARAAYGYTWHQCNQSERYVEYLDDIRQLELDDALHARVRNAIGRTGTLRCKEFALFQLGISESTAAPNVSDLNIADFPFAPEKFTLDLGTDEDGRY